MKKFEWDDEKHRINIEKHKVDFIDIIELFRSHLLHIEDTRADYGEKRIIGFGYLYSRLMVVVYTEPDPNITRIVSARKANNREGEFYEKAIKDRLESN